MANMKELLQNMIEKINDKANATDIPSIEGFASKTYIDEKIADLVNSAPETLDTLGELATAIQENEGVAEALNSAIGSKQDKITGYENQIAVFNIDGELVAKDLDKTLTQEGAAADAKAVGDIINAYGWNDLKNKPNEQDAFEILSELEIVSPAMASDGSIYTDKNGVVYSLI